MPRHAIKDYSTLAREVRAEVAEAKGISFLALVRRMRRPADIIAKLLYEEMKQGRVEGRMCCHHHLGGVGPELWYPTAAMAAKRHSDRLVCAVSAGPPARLESQHAA